MQRVITDKKEHNVFVERGEATEIQAAVEENRRGIICTYPAEPGPRSLSAGMIWRRIAYNCIHQGPFGKAWELEAGVRSSVGVACGAARYLSKQVRALAPSLAQLVHGRLTGRLFCSQEGGNIPSKGSKGRIGYSLRAVAKHIARSVGGGSRGALLTSTFVPHDLPTYRA